MHLRRIRFRDPETGKTLVGLTNQTTLPASTICDLYKSRWKVELFFKWIKQHLRIKRFYGTSENAVKTQIWIAVSVYVLVAIVRKRLNVEASLYTLMQVFSVTIFEKLAIRTAFLPGVYNSGNSMRRFDEGTPLVMASSKCFTQTVPGGNCQLPSALKAIVEFVSGTQNQRVFPAPSDQNGALTVYGMTPGFGVSEVTSLNAPV